jgi:hypothetical protein
MNQETQETDTLVPDGEWIDDADALADDEAFADDELDEQRPARRRRTVPPLAIGLGAVVIAGLGFIGGVQVQKRSGGEADGGMPAGIAAMMQAGGPGGAARGGAATGGAGATSSSATTGEVANVKGTKLYVTTADGSTVEVSVGKKATVQRLAEADADEIRPGDTVVVSGSTSGDGSVKATAVQATASGVSLLGGFGGRAGGPSASGASSGGSDAGRAAPADDAAAVDQLFESGD